MFDSVSTWCGRLDTSNHNGSGGVMPCNGRGSAGIPGGQDPGRLQADRGAPADGEQPSVELGRGPALLDRADLLAVEPDRALADQPPGLASGADQAGVGQQGDHPDLALTDGGLGDRQRRGRPGVAAGGAGPQPDPGVEGGLGGAGGLRPVVQGHDLAGQAALDVAGAGAAGGGHLGQPVGLGGVEVGGEPQVLGHTSSGMRMSLPNWASGGSSR